MAQDKNKEALEAFQCILSIGGWSVDKMCQEHINVVRKALTQSGWQPIETAPKDEEILMVNKNERFGCGYLPEKSVKNWMCRDWDDTNGKQIYPTHWMPLPKPPKE